MGGIDWEQERVIGWIVLVSFVLLGYARCSVLGVFGCFVVNRMIDWEHECAVGLCEDKHQPQGYLVSKRSDYARIYDR